MNKKQREAIESKDVRMLKKLFPKGTRIIMLEDMNDPQGLAQGQKGTVRLVDDIGSLRVSWDCGSSLGILPGIDEFDTIETE